MKKLTKILAVLLACITAFSSASMAADGTAGEETTTAVQEEITTTVQEETTTEVQETTTEPTTVPDVTVSEETTTEVQEETTTETQEETTTESATAPEEETTAPKEDETTTTTPEEETTEPEIVLPKAPTGLRVSQSNLWTCNLQWDYDETVQGYDIFTKINGEWVYYSTATNSACSIDNLLCYSEYEFGVRSFIIVNDVKCYSEDITTVIYNTPDDVPYVSLHVKRSYAGGIVFRWSNTNKSISGYILYRRVGNKWERIATIHNREAEEFDYKFPDMQTGKDYKFAIKTFVKGTKGTKYSKLYTVTMKISEIGKTSVKATNATASSITLEWDKVEGAKGYRLYKYNSAKKKYEAVKTTTKLSYTVTNLEASTKYRFRVRAYYKADGKTKWCTYSDSIATYTESKSVKASRVSKLKKYFTDGDWSVKITGLDDGVYGILDYTLAVKGDKIFVRYDYKNNKSIRDFEYLIDLPTETVNVIFDDNKTYFVLKGEEAELVTYSVVMMAMLLDMSTAKGVTAKTTVYSGKTAVAEIYTDKELGIKKTYYFINDKIKALKVAYADGSTETFKISKINDTPTSSVFKVPKGYKRAAY